MRVVLFKQQKLLFKQPYQIAPKSPFGTCKNIGQEHMPHTFAHKINHISIKQ